MASLVLKMSVSSTDTSHHPDGSSDWATAGRSEDGAAWTLETVSNAAPTSSAPRPYARWATFWPGAAGPFAKSTNQIPKVVFSTITRLRRLARDHNRHRDLAEAVTQLEIQRSDGYLLAQGGTRLARSLVATGLIDEYRLVVHPVVLGAGDRLFDTPLTIKPISTTAFSRGAVAQVFAADV